MSLILENLNKDLVLFFKGNRYTYNDLIQDADKFAFCIEKARSKILYWFGENYYSLICLFLAALKTNKILVPCISKERFLDLNKIAPDGIVFNDFTCVQEEVSNCNELENFAGLLIPTSGTSANPKLALLDEKMMFANALNAQSIQDLNTSDTILAVSGLGHTGGWNIHLVPGLLAGSVIHLEGFFSPFSFLRNLNQLKNVKVHLSPAQVNLLENTKSWANIKISNVKLVTSGSSEVWPATIRSLLQKGVEKVIRNYGLTEAGPMVFSAQTVSLDEELDSMGTLAVGFEKKLDNDNILQLKGEALFKGYFKEKKFYKRNEEWLDTGDIFIEKDNKLFYAGRKQHKIVTKAQGLYPSLVERKILQAIPEIKECCLTYSLSKHEFKFSYSGTALKDKSKLEAILKHETSESNVCLEYLSFLPRNANGKIDRQILC